MRKTSGLKLRLSFPIRYVITTDVYPTVHYVGLDNKRLLFKLMVIPTYTDDKGKGKVKISFCTSIRGADLTYLFTYAMEQTPF